MIVGDSDNDNDNDNDNTEKYVSATYFNLAEAIGTHNSSARTPLKKIVAQN